MTIDESLAELGILLSQFSDGNTEKLKFLFTRALTQKIIQ